MLRSETCRVDSSVLIHRKVPVLQLYLKTGCTAGILQVILKIFEERRVRERLHLQSWTKYSRQNYEIKKNMNFMVCFNCKF